jgi:hypothetical protein
MRVQTSPCRRPWLASAFCFWSALLACWLGAAEARAQLAITEVMSWASTNCCPGVRRGCHPDFWELTNFGTNSIDLAGYRFYDSGTVTFDRATSLTLLPSLIITPGESIIFVRETWPEVSDASEFRQWWGDTNLPTDLKIFFYPQDPGFDFLGDSIWLWDANTNLVDQISFGESRNGFTFAFDANSGAVVPSTNPICGAFQAARCGDIGSPGFATCGPVPLQITQQLVDRTVDAGSEVTFQVEATGLPRPRHFQWYFNGAPIRNEVSEAAVVPVVVNYAGCGVAWKPGPKPTDLTIANVQPSHAGLYSMVFFNGLEYMTSAVVTLTVNTNPTAPRVECPPVELRFPLVGGQPQTNLVVSPFQTAMLQVLVRGYPAPAIRWSWSADGARFTDLPGATNRSLLITPVVPGHAGIYRARLQNTNGSVFAYVALTVKDKPKLKITEAMSDSCYVYEDWWELTNWGDEPVDLYGYRWNDQPGDIGGGPTVTNSLIIQPGESVIFLEGDTSAPELFIERWGASNLPSRLRFIRYTANGFEADGDEINLWNSTATDPVDWIDSVGFSPGFGASMWFAPKDLCSEFGVDSVVGECGAFRSAQGCDVGSPGWTAWTPPQITSIRRTGQEVWLEWKAQPGSTNQLQYTSQLASPPSATVWSDLGTPRGSTGAIGTDTDSLSATAQRRFYRVKRFSAADCQPPCPPPEF